MNRLSEFKTGEMMLKCIQLVTETLHYILLIYEVADVVNAVLAIVNPKYLYI